MTESTLIDNGVATEELNAWFNAEEVGAERETARQHIESDSAVPLATTLWMF